MKILHTADIHLRQYKDERWQALLELIEIGKKEKIEIFVISGDLFDKGIDAENLRPKIREVFSNTGFKIVLISGNHDLESYKKGVFLGKDVIVLEDLEHPFEYKDLMIWGLPFEAMKSEEILKKLNSLKDKLNPDKKNILLYHGELLDSFFSREDFGEEGEERYMPIKMSYFKNLNIDYVLAGHFHSKFEMWKLENGGYFVYPGSPISITKKELGQRKVNIFELGQPPQEYYLDTLHYEEVAIELDPFVESNPIEIINEKLSRVHPKAKVILKITGYINSEKIKMSETEFANQIEAIANAKTTEIKNESRDISLIIEDSLFKRFQEKIKTSNYPENKKRQLSELVIKAIMNLKR